MKISLALAISCFATVQAAAIQTTMNTLATNDVAGNNIESVEIMDSAVLQSKDTSQQTIPDWLMEFKHYIEDENQIDFDLVSFLDKLEPNEVDDFMDLFVFMMDLEFADDDFEAIANE